MCRAAKQYCIHKGSVLPQLRAAEEAGLQEQDSKRNRKWLLRLHSTRQLGRAEKRVVSCHRLRQCCCMPS